MVRQSGVKEKTGCAQSKSEEPGGPEVLTFRRSAIRRRRATTQFWSRWLPPGSTARIACNDRAPIRHRRASDIPGLEIAGEVVGMGKAASRFRIGDKVCALVPGGGYAEFCVVDETNALPAPNGLTLIEAAAIPETFFTVWHNVFQRGGLKAGESFLVHGGTSGIGTTPFSLPRPLARRSSQPRARRPNAPRFWIGRGSGGQLQGKRFCRSHQTGTGGKGVDLIFDMVGGDYITRNYQAAAIEGRIVQIAFLNGRKAEADFSLLMMKRLTHTGSTLRARDIAFKAVIAERTASACLAACSMNAKCCR
jgi:NADPH2:quinone reductase